MREVIKETGIEGEVFGKYKVISRKKNNIYYAVSDNVLYVGDIENIKIIKK